MQTRKTLAMVIGMYAGLALAGAATSHAGSGLAPEEIQKVVRSRSNRYMACYQNGLHRDGELYGRVVVSMRIDAAGKPVDVKSTTDTDLPSLVVVQCVVDEFRRLKFPAQEGRADTTVVYPLDFANEQQ